MGGYRPAIRERVAQRLLWGGVQRSQVLTRYEKYYSARDIQQAVFDQPRRPPPGALSSSRLFHLPRASA
jgi:hypothetical protein